MSERAHTAFAFASLGIMAGAGFTTLAPWPAVAAAGGVAFFVAVLSSLSLSPHASG